MYTRIVVQDRLTGHEVWKTPPLIGEEFYAEVGVLNILFPIKDFSLFPHEFKGCPWLDSYFDEMRERT